MRLVALFLVLFALPRAARADSDGYYCHGPGYLAWETRLTGTDSQHTLQVVRFSHETGIQAAQAIALPDFQVHGMVCSATTVAVVGWTARYQVAIGDPARPLVTSEPAAFNPANAPPVPSLGQTARAGVIELTANSRTGEFELVIARVSRSVSGGIHHHIVSRLVQRAPGPRAELIASRVLLEGLFLETIDRW